MSSSALIRFATPRSTLLLLLVLCLAAPVSAASHQVWVSNEWGQSVSVIDSESLKVVATVPLWGRPRGIQPAHDGHRVYVALSDEDRQAQGKGDAIVAMDAVTHEIVKQYEAGTDPEQLTLSSDGRYLYAANEDAGTASMIDLDSGEVLETYIVGIEPEGIAISPDNRWVYVSAETSNTVSVIDTEARKVTASFLVGPRPRAVAFSPRGDRAYVTAEIGGTLDIVDTAAHQVIDSIYLSDPNPVGVVVGAGGSPVFIANGHGASVSVYDPAKGEETAKIPVGARVWNLAPSPDGSRLYTANGMSNDVSVVDVSQGSTIATVAVGERPWGIAVVQAPGGTNDE